jgi:hypothetical protein
MHITSKLSQQLGKTFVSTECSYIQGIKIQNNTTDTANVQVTFIYESEYLLSLLFKGVIEFELARETISCQLGELLFYDSEDDSNIIVGDELGRSFHVVCKDVQFIKIEKIGRCEWLESMHSGIPAQKF